MDLLQKIAFLVFFLKIEFKIYYIVKYLHATWLLSLLFGH